jgi:hypothetical protein
MSNPQTFALGNVVIPMEGPKVAEITLNFATQAEQTIDLSQLIQNNTISYVQCVFIDNYDNPDTLTLVAALTNLRIVVPANSQGYYSILAPNMPVFTVSTTVGAFNVTFGFLNVPVQPDQWSANAGGSFTGLTDAELRATPVPVDDGLVQALTDAQLVAAFPIPITRSGGAYTDRSNAALSGASQQLMAANANRKILIVDNVGATSIALNLTGGAAALNTAGSITILTGGSLIIDSYPPSGIINIIGTAAAAVTAYEG